MKQIRNQNGSRKKPRGKAGTTARKPTQASAPSRDRAELEESQCRFAELYDLVPVGYFSLDPQGRILSVNQTGAAMLGMVKGEAAQHPFELLVAEEDRDAFHLYLLGLLGEEGRQNTELRLRKKDGHPLDVQLEGIPVREEGGVSLRYGSA